MAPALSETVRSELSGHGRLGQHGMVMFHHFGGWGSAWHLSETSLDSEPHYANLLSFLIRLEVCVADLRKAPDIEQRVIDAVTKRTPQGQNYQIQSLQQKFLDGALYTVGFESKNEAGQKQFYTNRVYVTRNSIEAYGHDEFLIQVVGARHSRSFYDIFANSDVISGVIALVVTILIVPTFIASYFTASTVQVPDWITSGWLLILGFYFGKAANRTD